MCSGASMGFMYAPNKMPVCKDSVATITWHQVGVSGAVVAGNNPAWPHLDPGAFLLSFLFRSESNANADGGAFYIAFNLASAPTDAVAELVSGSGQTLAVPGNVNNVWIRKTVATDLINLVGAY